MESSKGYYADEKFADVIASLEAKGWSSCRHWTFPTCCLRYVNYSKIQWKYIKPYHIVNHLENAVLLSQKHKLLEYMSTRPSVDYVLPRSFMAKESWILWFVYYQAVLVLKNANQYLKYISTALFIATEIKRLNPLPSLSNEQKFNMIDMDFINKNDGIILPFLNALEQTEIGPVDDELKKSIDELLQHLVRCDKQFSFISTRNLWIAKPSGLSQGRGIEMITSIAELDQMGLQEGAKFVVQKYVERPLTILGRKFDIRQWVLVTKVHPLCVYWYDECYLRFSAKEYNISSDGGQHDKTMHLCNNSIQKYVDIPHHPEIPDNMWSSQQFQSHLEHVGKHEIWLRQIIPAMKFACIEAIRSVEHKLRRVGQGFEWLGLDFIIDEEFHPWLLEVNVSPDVSHSTSTTAALVPKATQDMLSIILDQEEGGENGWKRLDINNIADFTYNY
ncbi:hypothetical protein THRCLA_21393 [Thraustotheca clavata]|uniref:Tubulin-tyrosine ligase family n=1 Tax=Thraustotheca clavata TaxID=74557 RepID=A0A1V9ZX07_9STRA|nr:hypothetical protein THRCLA_21393 [Thraustotheca clavata]